MQIINDNIPEFRRSPLVVLLLGFFTCGLYMIYWNIKMAKVMNAVAGKEVVSEVMAVFCGCIYPLNIYFFYVIGRDCLPAVYEFNGEPDRDDSLLLLLLGAFFPMVAAMIVQGEVNKMYDRR